MTASGSIIKIIPTIQSAALLNDNYKFYKKKKKKTKDFISQGAKNIIGTSLIKAEGEFLWD